MRGHYSTSSKPQIRAEEDAPTSLCSVQFGSPHLIQTHSLKTQRQRSSVSTQESVSFDVFSLLHLCTVGHQNRMCFPPDAVYGLSNFQAFSHFTDVMSQHRKELSDAINQHRHAGSNTVRYCQLLSVYTDIPTNHFLFQICFTGSERWRRR